MRAIAAELVRQTPFRSQRCLNFLEILTTCPRGPIPLPDSPTETRRRSRSELRCWPSDSPTEKTTMNPSTILDESRRRARSELRGWSSSNSSDEDLLGEFRSIPAIISTKDQPVSRAWGCSESSEGSDDSLPWGGVCRSSVDCVDSTVTLSEPETREQRIQRYKEARRRENEARSRRVLEEDARRRKAKAEENNNNLPKIYNRTRSRLNATNDNDDVRPTRLSKKDVLTSIDAITRNDNSIIDRLPPVKPSDSNTVRFTEEVHRNEDDKRNNNSPKNGNGSSGILRSDTTERRSRARERRIFRDRGQDKLSHQHQQLTGITIANVETLRERKERLALLSSRIPVSRQLSSQSSSRSVDCPTLISPKSPSSPSALTEPPCEEVVAKLLERCQRVDHYVPVREKLTLFESLSRLGGRLARSTEDLGRTSSKPSPRGKQRARSLHDLNRGARAVPVREMCRFFEGDLEQDANQRTMSLVKTRFSEPTKSLWKDSSTKHDAISNKNACARRKHYLK